MPGPWHDTTSLPGIPTALERYRERTPVSRWIAVDFPPVEPSDWD
jgi:hypothetical protein